MLADAKLRIFDDKTEWKLNAQVFQEIVVVVENKPWILLSNSIGSHGAYLVDFVLWSPKGSPSVQRIFRDDQLIDTMMKYAVMLWKHIIASECFEMRAPRRLIKPVSIRD